MKKITAILILTIVGFCLLTCDQVSKKVILSYKYKSGTILEYSRVEKGNVRKFAGDSIIAETAHESHKRMIMTVKNVVDDSIAVVGDVTITKSRVVDKLTQEVADTTYENEEWVFHIAPSGRVVDFVLPPKDAENEGLVEYLRNVFEQGSTAFPSYEVSVGHRWTHSSNVVLDDKEMEASMTHEVKSFVREHGYDCAVIEYEGNLVLPIGPCPVDTTILGGFDHGVAKGVIYFAYKEGFEVLLKERYTVNGTRYNLVDGRKVEQEVEVEFEIESALVSIKKP